jgi:Na+/melibiose symporter-like transporter
MLYYALLTIFVLSIFVIFVMQASSFAWIYFAVWVVQGSIPFALLTAMIFGTFVFLIVFVPPLVKKIRSSSLRKNIKVTKYFADNPAHD